MKTKTGWKICAVFLLAASVFLAAAGTVLGIRIVNTKKYGEQLTLGNKYLKEMDYENAEIHYKNALKIDAEKAAAYLNLSAVYAYQGRYEDAEALLQKALTYQKDDMKIQKALQNIRKKEEENQEVLQSEENAEEPKTQGEDNADKFAGTWVIDDAYTMEQNQTSMTHIFGTGYRYGSEMVISQDGSFSYYIGIGNGGEGTWQMKEQKLEYQITTYETSEQENGEIEITALANGEIRLSMPYWDNVIYWEKTE